jgi:hypothetical protein
LTERNRVYSEQEASEILQKAAKLQEAQIVGPDYTPGVTLDELRRIAEEAGIDPKVLDQALADGSQPIEKAKWPFEIERVLDGELAPDDFDLIQTAIGAGTQVGRTLNATVWTGTGMTSVMVSSRNGRTRLSMKANPFFSLFFVLYPLLVITFATTAIGSGNRSPFCFIPLLWLVALFLGMVLTPLSLKRHRRKAEEKMVDLELKVAETLAETGLEQEAKRARLVSASPATIDTSISQDLTLGEREH